MATVKICDRCGAPINPINSGTRVFPGALLPKPLDLCVSCAYQLRKWLNNEPIEEARKNGQPVQE